MSDARPFFVLGTPRSRTAWLAQFLCTKERLVLHEPTQTIRSMDDLQALVCRPGVAIVDSMLTLRWRDLVRWVPQARFAVVLRDEDEVLRSLRNIGFASPAVTAMVQRIRHEAKVFAKLHRVYQVTYVSLNRMEPCVNLHKRLTGLECDEAKWQHFMQRNIQVNPKLVTENARQNMAGIFDVYPEMLGVLSMASASA